MANEAIPGEVGAFFESFARRLRALGRSPRTIESYGESIARLVRHGSIERLDQLTTAVVETWLTHEGATTAPASVGVRYRSVRAFLNWLTAEGEIERSPMANIPHPKQPETLPNMLSADDVRKLLEVTKPADARDWRSKRDRALVLFLLDSGCRRAETAGLTMADLDLNRGEATVLGKGGSRRTISLGTAAVAALDQWVRARRKLSYAIKTEAIWISDRGALTDEGVRQVLLRLGREAGVKVNPHAFRHSWAHMLRANGMGDAELMALAGWTSPAMLSKYGRSAVGQRARDQHKRIAPGDSL